MDQRKLNYFKEKLLKEKDQALATLSLMESHQSNRASMKQYTEELSSYDNHPADLGTEMYITSMQANLENHHRYRITEIDKALEKIKEGNYGLCELCGQKMKEERLEVLPEANICIECAKGKLPVDPLTGDRPVEEQLMSPSFRTSYRDYRDFTGFDEEDAYQAVAKFNEVKSDPSFSTGDHLDIFDENPLGIVEEVENISEDYYRSQLPYTGDGIMEVDKKSRYIDK